MTIRSLFVSDILPHRPAGGAVQRMDVVTAALAGLGRVDALFLAPPGAALPLEQATRFDRSCVASVPPHTGVRAGLEIVARGPVAAYAGHQRRTLVPVLPDWSTAPPTTWCGSTVSGPGCRCAASSPAGPSWTSTPVSAARVAAVGAARQPEAAGTTGGAGPAASPAAAEVERPAARDGGGAVVLFQGTFDWAPNADAAAWLVGEVLPLVRKRVPDVTVVLAGRSTPQVAALAGPYVEVTGTVPSMTPYLRAADLVVVPLRVGSGTRIKILEAFAHGVPVVSTTIGAEGLDVVPGEHLAVADTADALARHCADLLTTSCPGPVRGAAPPSTRSSGDHGRSAGPVE